MTRFELLPEGGEPAMDAPEHFVWPTGKGATDSVVSDLGAWLSTLGELPTSAVDLVRLAAGAYFADRRARRGAGFSRTIDLHVQLVDVEPWRELSDELADLLFWLTGDHWMLGLSDDGLAVPEPIEEPAAVSTVALLSGGLDSFCGAVANGPTSRLFLGHWDNPTVKGAQNAVSRWLEGRFGEEVIYDQVKIVNAEPKREGSSRSRSFLFLALAAAVATGRQASTVEVPENGYTSLNPALGPERGGALTTRSTHPLTLARVNAILDVLELPVRIDDPYAALTKGELVEVAARGDVDRDLFLDGTAVTLSCGKLDGGRYRGGNPNHHCGLCYPCLVRRGAIAASELEDRTTYLSDTLTGDALARLRRNRADDVHAVTRATGQVFDDTVLIASGPFPDGFDLDAAVDLCERGLEELRHVDLDWRTAAGTRLPRTRRDGRHGRPASGIGWREAGGQRMPGAVMCSGSIKPWRMAWRAAAAREDTPSLV